MLVLLGNSLAPTLRSYFEARVRGDDRNIQLLPTSIGKFASTEAFAEIKPEDHDIKGKPVVVMQSLASVNDDTANDYAMQLLLTIQTLKRGGAGPIWVVMPFAGYSRQDRDFDGRMTSVGIDAYAQLLKSAGAQGVSTIDMHSDDGLNFMNGHFGPDNVYNLSTTEIFANDIRGQYESGVEFEPDDYVVGGPDEGANDRANNLATELQTATFETAKKHEGVNKTTITDFNGNVAGKNAVVVDDMIDTGGTIENIAQRLNREGAQACESYAAHGLFSKGGLERLFRAKAPNGQPAITRLVVTDTIDITGKLDALRRQYNPEDVDNTIEVISAGQMLFDHIEDDILPHPAMALRGAS